MRRRLLPFYTIGIIILVVVLILHTFGVTGTGKRLQFETVDKGYYSGHFNPAYHVINGIDELADVWKKHTEIVFPEPLPPDVDFSKTTIIAVFMGQFSTGGYGIEVKEIIDTGLSVVVKVEKSYPGKGCVVTLAFSQPYHIVKVDKIDRYVLFDTITTTGECG